MKAVLRNYRQSPRKVHLLGKLIEGKPVERAIIELDFLGKRASGPIKKLLQSAVANAKINNSLDRASLVVKSFTVNKGVTLKRMMPRARGSAFPIRKHTSNVTILLESKK